MTDHVNYYDILEIPQGSEIDEVEKAFKKLAKKWHPDKNKNNKEAEKKYKDITEAYSILTDENKKQVYDKFGIDGLRGGVGETTHTGPEQVFQIMNQMGMGGMLGNMMGMMQQREQEDENCGISNVQVPLQILLEDAYTGKKIKQNVKRLDLCSKCEGTGAKNKEQDTTCTVCNGNSKMTAHMGMMCGACKNTGFNPAIEKCKKCNGKKGIETEVEVEVTVPRGVFNKTRIILKEEGHEIPKNRTFKGKHKDRSDLEFIILSPNESEDGKLKRGVELIENVVDPSDMFTTIEIPFVDSLSGFVHEIDHLDGHKVKVCFPDSCRHMDMLVVKGEGMPRLGKNKIVIKKGDDYTEPKNVEFGNLVVQVEVQHPKELEMDSDVKAKVVKLLGGKQFKTQKGVPNSITLEQHIKDFEIQFNSERMKESYSKKKVSKHQCDEKDCNEDHDLQEYDTDSDESDGGNGGFNQFNGLPPGAQMHVQECTQS